MDGFLRELQRRNVLRAGLLYATSIWALAQGIASLGPTLGAPDWTTRWFLVAAVIGFPFWIAFAWFYELTPQGIKLESEVVQSEQLSRAAGRKLDFWIIGALAVAVVLLLTDRFVGHNGETAAAVIADKSIAVLPLVNESGDANALYFSDGLSEGFIDALSQFAGLKVIGRASSFQFRGSKEPVAVIGEKLGVAHLLEGSVQHAGDAVRISAELIDTKDGTTLWSERYDRPYKDLFKLQDEITNAVAAALKAKLLGGGKTPLQSDRPPSGSLAAYNAFLEGKFFGLRGDEADYRKSIDAFDTAIRLDPHYARAWADLAIGLAGWASNYLGGAAQQQAYARARKATDTALALAPNLGASHAARSSILEYIDFDPVGSEVEARRALQLDPNSPLEKTSLAISLSLLGHVNQAFDLDKQALAADPLSAPVYENLGSDLVSLGRLSEGEQAFRKAMELEPAATWVHGALSTIAILRGNAKAALDEAHAEPPGVSRDIAVDDALQIGSNRVAADAALKALIGKHSSDAAYQIAQLYALRKDPDKMFAWLERARVQKDPGLAGLLADPFILPYRHDPRFAALCKKLKLPTTTDARLATAAH